MNFARGCVELTVFKAGACSTVPLNRPPELAKIGFTEYKK